MGTPGLNGPVKVGYCINITGFSLDFEVRFFVTRVQNLFSSLQAFGDHVIQSNRLMFILLSFKTFLTDIGFSYVSDASSNIPTKDCGSDFLLTCFCGFLVFRPCGMAMVGPVVGTGGVGCS
jgi:hypothetical protein